MATATRTVESLDSLRAVDVKIVEPRSLEGSVKITQAGPAGEKLGAEKGINVPESQLGVSSLIG